MVQNNQEMHNSKLETAKKGRLIDVSHFNPLILAFLVMALTLIGYFLVRYSHGANTSLYLSPATSTVASGANFDVAVRLSTADNVNLVHAYVTYPATLLDFVSVSGAGSAFTVDAGSGGGSGSITISRTSPSGVAVTGDQLIAIISFKAKTTAGTAAVAFVNNAT